MLDPTMSELTLIFVRAVQISDPESAEREMTVNSPQIIQAVEEAQAVYSGVRGNKSNGTRISLADQLLMIETAFRRAVQIIDEAQAKKAAGGVAHGG